MGRHPKEDSVSTLVKKLKTNEIVKFDNPYSSVAVMVSLLRKQKEHQNKIFKLHCINGETTVKRVK